VELIVIATERTWTPIEGDAKFVMEEVGLQYDGDQSNSAE